MTEIEIERGKFTIDRNRKGNNYNWQIKRGRITNDWYGKIYN